MQCKSSLNQNVKHKKGLWSPDEDKKLKDYILNHGLGCWSFVPVNAGLQRNGKSCRLRWTNYLRPGLKRGKFTKHEEQKILTLHGKLGNKWSEMSRQMPGRSDNEIKNHWHSYLKKKYAKLENTKTKSTSSDTLNEQSSSDSSLKSRSSSLESYSKEVDIGIRPKILFSEWLSLDQCHTLDTSDELSIYHASSSQQTNMSCGSGEKHVQLSPELVSENEFYDMIFEENVCPDFNINDVRMLTCDDLYSASTPSI
ncbi:transcription factor LAF1-like [Rutidosis leptorrhynchoides]|uniref:transcription factor LAF1-like n=1 Tax=Rutidosis leptorrhynchoides TaxID=125765 RepID=UPI003A9A1424